jgi:hypothetical protein
MLLGKLNPMSMRSWINTTEVNVKSFIASFIFFVSTVSLIFAQAIENIADPEVDFVSHSFTFKSATQHDVVIRKDIDLFSNGNLAIFLRSAVGGGKLGQYWTAYLPSQGGGYQRIEDIQFREDTFKAGTVPEYNPGGGIVAYYPGKGGGDLMRLQVIKGQVEVDKLRSLDAGKEEDCKLFESLFGRRMDEPLPREYFANPPHKVIDVKEIIARAPAAQITTPSRITTEQSTPVPTPPPAPLEKQTPKPAASLTPAAEPKPSPSGFPIVPVAIIAAVIVGIVFYFLRRKSK